MIFFFVLLDDYRLFSLHLSSLFIIRFAFECLARAGDLSVFPKFIDLLKALYAGRKDIIVYPHHLFRSLSLPHPQTLRFAICLSHCLVLSVLAYFVLSLFHCFDLPFCLSYLSDRLI